MAGSFQVKVGEDTTKFKADASEFKGSDCTATLSGMKSMDEVSCTLDSVNSETGTGQYMVVIDSYPAKPYENNLFSHSGNIPSSAISCNVTSVSRESASSPSCIIDDVVGGDAHLDGALDGNSHDILQSMGLPLYIECGGHGSCRENGTCSCARGYYGDSCSRTVDDVDIDSIISTGPFFTGTVLKIDAERTSSAEFNLFKASINPSVLANEYFKGDATLKKAMDITIIRGDREFIHNGGHTVNGGAKVVSCNGDCSSSFDGIGSSAMTVAQLPASGDSDAAAITTVTKGDGNYHLRAYDRNGADVQEVFSVSSQGTLRAASGSFVADEGLVTTTNVKVAGSFDVSGPVTLADSLTLGSEFTLTPGGMTVSVDRHTGTLLELRSGQEGFDGSLLELHSAGNSSAMLRTVVDGVKTFELQSNGDMICQSLIMRTGGVEVEAGGVNIASGGLKVESGGVTIMSGELNIANADLKAESIKSFSGALGGSLMHAKASNAAYSGSMLKMEAADSSDPSVFDFIEARGESGDVVFTVGGDGDVMTTGGVHIGEGSTLSVGGRASFAEAMTVEPKHVKAGPLIKIPLKASFVIIDDDATRAANAIQFISDASGELGYAEGSILIIQNLDAEATATPYVPSYATAFFVYSDNSFHEISSSVSGQTEFRAISALELSNDVDTGNYTFGVGRISMKNLAEGQVPVSGLKGILSSYPMFTYVKGILSAPAIKINKLLSDVDARGHAISNAEIVGCGITNATIAATSLVLPSLAGDGSSLTMFDEDGQLGRADGSVKIEVASLKATSLTVDSAVTTSLSADTSALGEVSASTLALATLSHTDPSGFVNVVVDRDGTLVLHTTDTTQNDDVKSISADAADVTALTSDSANVKALISDKADVKALTSDMANVKALSSDSAIVKVLSSDKADVKALTSDMANVKVLSSDKADVNALTSDSANVKVLISDKADVKVLDRKSVV